jgi:hypothetical protein
MRRWLWSAVVVALAAVAAGAADDKPKPADPPEKAKTVAEVKKQAEEAQREAYKKYDAMSEDEKKDRKKVNELFNGMQKEQAKFHEAAFELAKADPKADAAAEAINWVLPQTMYQPLGEKVFEFATEHLATSPKIANAVLALGRYGLRESDKNYKAAEAFLAAVKEKNKEKPVLAVLAMANAWAAKNKYDAAEYRQQKDADELAAVADKLFEAATKEFGEVKLPARGEGQEGQTVAAAAKVELFELRNLRVGKTAPDIEGEDLDGTKFKLSDYKGKVVVLDFWGDW